MHSAKQKSPLDKKVNIKNLKIFNIYMYTF